MSDSAENDEPELSEQYKEEVFQDLLPSSGEYVSILFNYLATSCICASDDAYRALCVKNTQWTGVRSRTVRGAL